MSVNLDSVQSNMVFVDVLNGKTEQLARELEASHGVRVMQWTSTR